MLKKLNRVLSITLILTVIGVSLFWVLQHRALDTSQGTPGVSGSVEPPQAQQTQKVSKASPGNILTDEKLATPEVQELLQARESPEYQDFLETHPGSVDEVFAFFESQGVQIDQNQFYAIFNRLFQEHFPHVSAEELEPQMREKLASLFLESGIQLETAAQGEGIEDLMAEFLAEKQNIAWLMEHFQGDYVAFGLWAIDVFQNPAPPATPTPVPLRASDPSVPVDANHPSTSAQDTSLDVEAKQRIDPHDNRDAQSVDKSVINRGSEFFIKDEDNTEEAFVPDSSKLPTNEESLRAALRKSFSAERYNAALTTLNRHGPQEGLHRLKASDPEVATHIERIFRKQKEEN